jgi:hypothetical protein
MTTILIKKKDTAGAPAPGDLTNAAGGAEIAVNTSDLKIYTKNSGGAIVQVGSGPSATDTLTNKSISGSANTITNVSLTTGVTGTLPVANGGTGITSFGAGVATFLGTPSSANLAAAVTDETGTGALVFANSPTLVTPALGTPASGVVTNLTGTASININGTVGATTANTGAFTTLTASSTSTLNGTTIPASVTLVSTAATQTLTNKTLTSPAIAGGTITNVTQLTVAGTSSAGASVRLFEDTDNGTNYVDVKAPDTLGSDVVSTLPATTTTLAGLAVAQAFTASQRGAVTTDNDGSFDMNAGNNFLCTPSAGFTLTFTNITTGQSGNIVLVNGSNYAVAAAAAVKVASTTLATISTTGTYWLSYYSPDGTNVYVAATGVLA